MKSDRLTQSNRANALKSTGPRTAAGKAASSMNALTTGIYANKLIILGESLADFEKLSQENFEFYLPVTPEERFHLDVMIRSEWQLRRLSNVESQVWHHCSQKTVSGGDEECLLGKIYYHADTVFARLDRQKSTVYRTYKDASAELAALQAARYQVEQAAKAEAETAAAEAERLVATQPEPTPKPIATEATYPQLGFVPSNEPAAPPVAPVVDFCHRCPSEEAAPDSLLPPTNSELTTQNSELLPGWGISPKGAPDPRTNR